MVDEFNYWNWEDKERAKLRKRDAGSVQTGTSFDYWIITGVVELGFRSGLYVWKAKT